MKKKVSWYKFLWRANLKTIYFNFKYLPWRKAIKMPIWVSSNTYLRKVAGTVHIPEVVYPGMIRIGYGDIGIFDKHRSRSIWENAGEVVFRGTAEIGHGSKIGVGENGQLLIGKNFTVTAETAIIAYKKVSFGDDCLISWEVLIMDTDFHPVMNESQEVVNHPQEITIGDAVWIGCRSTILKGSIIPNGSIIAANCLVSKKLAGENQIYGSQSIQMLAQNMFWKK